MIIKEEHEDDHEDYEEDISSKRSSMRRNLRPGAHRKSKFAKTTANSPVAKAIRVISEWELEYLEKLKGFKNVKSRLMNPTVASKAPKNPLHTDLNRLTRYQREDSYFLPWMEDFRKEKKKKKKQKKKTEELSFIEQQKLKMQLDFTTELEKKVRMKMFLKA